MLTFEKSEIQKIKEEKMLEQVLKHGQVRFFYKWQMSRKKVVS